MTNWRKIISDEDRSKVKGWVTKAPPGTLIAFAKPDNRSAEQNALLWKWLTLISKSTDWHGEILTPDEWKDLFSASLKQARVVPGIEGGVVVLGLRTSKMTKAEFTALLEFIQWFAAQRGIILSEDEAA